MEELQQAMNGVKNRKVPGLNRINAELIKYGGILLHLRLLHFFNKIWKENKIPGEWRLAQGISLYKKETEQTQITTEE